MNKIRIELVVGEVKMAPPVGPSLSQYGFDVNGFLRKFNNESVNVLKKGTVVNVVIFLDKNMQCTYKIKGISTSYLVKNLLINGNELQLYDLYNIALLKSEFDLLPMEQLVKNIVGTVKSMGIKIV